MTISSASGSVQERASSVTSPGRWRTTASAIASMVIPFVSWVRPGFSIRSTGGSLDCIAIRIDDIGPEKIVGKDKRPDDGQEVEHDLPGKDDQIDRTEEKINQQEQDDLALKLLASRSRERLLSAALSFTGQ